MVNEKVVMFPFCLKEFLTWQNYDNVIYQKNLRGSKASLHQFLFFFFFFLLEGALGDAEIH